MIKKPYKQYENVKQDLQIDEIPIYEETIDNRGKKQLTEKGKTNIYDFIQASLEETKINNIISKYESGNIDILNKINGLYGDFTNMPKSLMEAQQMIKNMENKFNELPIEYKTEFNNNPYEMISIINTKEFNEKLKNINTKIYEKIQNINKTEVIENE